MKRKIRWLGRKIRGGLSNFILENRLDPFPIRHGFRNYGTDSFLFDVRAGINVALLSFPQGMAYAVIAGLPIQYGITCSIVASLVAPFFASSRHTILGPTNATAYMIFSTLGAMSLQNMENMLPLVVFLSGFFLVVGAYTRVADLVQYISRSVVVGYLTGASLLIIINQLKHLFRIEMPSPAPKTFFGVIYETVARIPQLHLATLLVGVGSIALYFGLIRKFSKLPVFAIVLVVASLVVAIVSKVTGIQFSTFDSYTLGDLLPVLPDLRTASALHNAVDLVGIAFAVAFLASLENSVMSKTLASQTGDRTDMNQDMLSVGVANLASSFLSGMPASGSLTRSALNYASGAVSQFSSIISGLLCLAGLLLLGNLVDFIPKVCLAALVICIALSLINLRNIRIVLNTTKSDAVVAVLTFFATLTAPLHIAIFFGVAVSIMLYLRKASRPYLSEYQFTDSGELTEKSSRTHRMNPQISIVHVEGDLFFGAADLFRTQIIRTIKDESIKVIILRLKNARHLDATSTIALKELLRFVRERGRHVIISGASKDVYRVLKNSGLVDIINESGNNLFLNTPHNPNIATRNALIRAQELLGTREADIKIYVQGEA